MAADRINRKADAARPKDPARDNASSDGVKRGLTAATPGIANKSLTRSRLTDTLFLAHLFATGFPKPQPGDNASYRKQAKRPAKKRRMVAKKV